LGLRAPTATLVVDANIVIREALGSARRSLIRPVAERRLLVTTVRATEEVAGVLGDAKRRGFAGIEAATRAFGSIDIIHPDVSADLVDEAAEALRLAAASRNGSARDAHLLALAWALDADIWSHDRDFAGTGWPSWYNGNLLAALTAGAAAIP
jgi:predicted nucleic acid-binding protein